MVSKLEEVGKGTISRSDFDNMFQDYLHQDFITEEQFGLLVSSKEQEMLGILGVNPDIESP